MDGLIAELKYQLRYALPFWFLQLLTNWWPDNRITIKVRGAMFWPFFKRCGRNFTIGKNVTFTSFNKIEIGDNVYIATGTWINGLGGLVIDDEVEISPYVVLDSSVHVFKDNSVRFGGSILGTIRIGRGSWLASHVVVRAGVTIGSGVLVAANAVVVKDVPDNVMVGGVPAEVIGPRKDKDPSEAVHSRSFDRRTEHVQQRRKMIDSKKNKMLLEKPIMVIAVNIVRSLTTLCKGQIAFYKQHGFDVDAMSHNDLPNGVELVTNEGASFFEMDFIRDVSPREDLRELKRMYRLFRRRRPTIIQLMSPKPCILGTIAGRLAGVPIIVRHVWGNLRDADFKGTKRFFLSSAERLSNILAHQVIVISHKLRDSEVSAGALNPKKAVVFGSGSSNGLDLNRFKLTPERKEKGRQLRQQLQIADSWKVLGTAMRINIEKGICELVEAYLKLSEKIPDLALMILGDYDIRGQPPEHIIRTIDEHPRIHLVGFQENIEDYYAAMDLFVMPSYREGFCKSNIEANGMGLPVVATNIIGCSESVLDGITGLLVPPRNSDALADAIEQILTNPQLAQQLGKNGRERVEREFDQKLIWHEQLRNFCCLMQEKGIRPPVNPEVITGTACPMCRE